MPNAISLYHFRWRKKKAKSFIIPPTYFRNNTYSITDSSLKSEQPEQTVKDNSQITNTQAEEISTLPQNDDNPLKTTEAVTTVEAEKVNTPSQPVIVTPPASISNQPKVSALSLGSIRAKKELEAKLKPIERHHDELPTEPFTETQMLEQWIKYANRLGEKGYKILESLLLLNDPKLEGTTIIHELPNESSKIDFDGEKHDLLGYLRGKLHNHNITIEIKINETIELKKAFTTQEKYDRMKDINPALDILRKTFDLDL
jgi:hypothetical protein